MRIALIGATGQLGSELSVALPGDVVPLRHADIELSDASSVETVLSSIAPEIVLNTAAYNQVDKAEDQPDLAYAVNAIGPRNLARYCAANDVALLHVSSDYVFGLSDDQSTPYLESDTPGPMGAYGTSKLAGEYFIRSLCRRHYVVRTCGLYGHHAAHGNFVETMLRLGKERKQVSVVNDQRCTPTSCSHLAKTITDLIATDAYGLYHSTNSGSTTWYEFALEIFRLANVDVQVGPISTSEFGAKAVRPAYSVLDTSKLNSLLGYELPTWQDALAEYLAE